MCAFAQGFPFCSSMTFSMTFSCCNRSVYLLSWIEFVYILKLSLTIASVKGFQIFSSFLASEFISYSLTFCYQSVYLLTTTFLLIFSMKMIWMWAMVVPVSPRQRRKQKRLSTFLRKRFSFRGTWLQQGRS